MKSAAQIDEWFVDLLSHVYSRPTMYGISQSDLDSFLYALHFMWAAVMDREREFCTAYHPISHAESVAMRPEGFYDKIREPSELAMVVSHYKEVDRRLGLSIPPPKAVATPLEDC